MQVPLVTNVDAAVVGKAAEARDSLVRQVSSPVRWLESVELLIKEGVDTFVEVGPGKVLTGLMRQISREVRCFNVEDAASLKSAEREPWSFLGGYRYFITEEQNEMPDQEIENKVKQIIVDELGVDENEVTPNARFIDDLGADSLDTVELVMRFEEEFGIEIPDEDAEKIQSVRDAYNYIDQHKK